MNKRKTIRNLSIFLLLGALVVLGALWLWNGPPFDRQPNLAAAAPEVVLAAAEANQPAEAVFQPQLAPQNARVGASDNPAATPTPTGQSACSSVGSLSALILGIDENEQADAIRLMRVDFAQERISVVSIPRDFWVPVADMQAHGIKFGRINATYGYGEFYNGKGGGIKSLTANIQSNFGVSVDRYFVLHFADIKKYIDKIGGVDVTLEEPVWDTERSFRAGAHHFDGETAVLFMRMREGDSDFFRVRRQSLVLSAFYKKVMHELSVWQLVKLGVSVIGDHAILTNFNAKDVYTLACLAGRISGEDVAFIEIPKDLYHPMTTNLGASVIIPHDGVAAFLQSVMDGSYKPEEK
ncbi:MAG TPA: LCP family protein [Anaerolineaceae bacterium]|nr:LCP family protein [Anaerolineaceae bacterium]HQC21946.1 LCP family protein [Anaerolineaceae bacterium]